MNQIPSTTNIAPSTQQIYETEKSIREHLLSKTLEERENILFLIHQFWKKESIQFIEDAMRGNAIYPDGPVVCND